MIRTEVELTGMGDLNHEWKIAAVRSTMGWIWCGDLGREAKSFTARMFPEPGASPVISCVTGRDAHGNEVLYARLYPAHLKTEPPKRPMSDSEWRRFK